MHALFVFGRKRKFLLCMAALFSLCLIAWLCLRGLQPARTVLEENPLEVNDAIVRAKLLQESLWELGLCSSDAVAELWARGVQQRSGAMQYAALSNALKPQYAASLERSFPGWVTGVSSPWVASFALSAPMQEREQSRYLVTFSTETSDGPFETLHAQITVAQQNGYYGITEIIQDEGLQTYSGYGFTAP